MKNLIKILLIFVFLSNYAFSQDFQINWQQCFGGSKDDHALDIIKLDDGFLIAGCTNSNDGDISFNHGYEDGWLLKIDTQGILIWEKSYGGTKGDGIRNLVKCANGDYFLICGANSSDGDISNDPYFESTDFWILKIDSLGNIIWDKIVGGNGLDQIWTGTATSDGGILAYGWTSYGDGDVSVYYGLYDSWMVKLNSNGEKEWDFTIGTSGMDAGQAIIQTSDGGYLAGSSSMIEEGGNITCVPHSYKAEAVLVKLDSMRNIEWQHCYGGSDNDGVVGLLELKDGYVFLAYCGSNDGDISGWHGYDDIWVVKIDFFGNIIWQKSLGGSRWEYADKIFQTEDSGLIIFGNTESHDGDVVGNHSLSGIPANDIWIVKLSSEGELLWQKCIGGLGNEIVDFGVYKKSDNNYVIAGQTTNGGPSFDVECTPHPPPPGWGAYPDFWVFEIQDTTTNIINNINTKEIIKVYPNPAQDYVSFEYNLPVEKKDVILSVINILGIETAHFKINDKKGIKVWNTKNIKPGIYFYNLNVSGFSKSGKIIISYSYRNK